MIYNSAEETLKHIKRVQEILDIIISKIEKQGLGHDKSKLEEPEKSFFDEMTPKLKNCTYNSAEYHRFLEELKPALDHHYKNNSHHPEHTEKGFGGMTLVDVLECFADWKAASERHANGDFKRSIEINSIRFNMDPQLIAIFENTRKEFNL